MLSVHATPLAGLFLIEPETTHDLRGLERPGFHPTQYAAFGLTGRFASDRYVRSFQGTLRGLYILPAEQHALLTLVRGDVTVVVVDMRPESKTFGTHQMIDLTEAQNRQIYISGGMAYGVCVRSDIADMHEKFTGFYDKQAINGLFWNDKELGIQWPVTYPLISDEEARFPSLAHYHRVCV
jgi:dTDP-4-dehydrorhamnose 3,5-epimerase